MDKLQKAISEAKAASAEKDFKGIADDILASPINQINLATTTIDQAMTEQDDGDDDDKKKGNVAEIAKTVLTNMAKGFEKKLAGYKFEIKLTVPEKK
jgi:hypothetical protein